VSLFWWFRLLIATSFVVFAYCYFFSSMFNSRRKKSTQEDVDEKQKYKIEDRIEE